MSFGGEPKGHDNRHLVAPELRARIDATPPSALSAEGLETFRGYLKSPETLAAMAPPMTPELETVTCEERFIPGLQGAPDIRVLIYTPPKSAAALKPAYLHIHGGGYVMGLPEMCDGPNKRLAAQLDCIVVSVDYRLAPETPFPGPLEDCYAALSWMHRDAGALGIDAARIAIGGESGGGGHAAALAQYARDKGEIAICLQMLDSPMIDHRTGSTIAPHDRGVYIWSPESNVFGWTSYLGAADADNPPAYFSPSRNGDLSGLAPTYIAVGALDLFLEENLDYARRLIRAGVPTEVHVLPGVYHGGRIGDTPQARALHQLMHDALKRAFAQG